MTISEQIHTEPHEWQSHLLTLHGLILHHDQKVAAAVAPLMGRQMIVYQEAGIFKYALAVGKEYLSLHCMPIYCRAQLHEQYRSLLPGAKFQKGCINFRRGCQVLLPVIGSLLADCATVSMPAISAVVKNSSD